MPIYEYICRDCDARFEAIVTASRAASCPTCVGTDLEKQLSVFAVSGTSSSAPASSGSGPVSCGSCGDPRGPGACNLN